MHDTHAVPLKYSPLLQLPAFSDQVAVNVIVAPLTDVAVLIDSPAAYELFAHWPLLAVQVQPAKSYPFLVYVLLGALHVPP